MDGKDTKYSQKSTNVFVKTRRLFNSFYYRKGVGI